MRRLRLQLVQEVLRGEGYGRGEVMTYRPQHDHHLGPWIDHILNRIINELFAPGEFGWNEWSRYAANGEWI
jgi:hypothetical protein